MAEVSTLSANDPYGPVPLVPEEQAVDVRSALAPEMGNVSAYGDVQGAAVTQGIDARQPAFERSEPAPDRQVERDVPAPGE
jgi:hypothetical protein